MWSTSGRSSRSTFTLTKLSFITAAIAGFSNDSRSITWHQWQAEYPTESSTGLSSVRARTKASSPHGYQSTGLWACWSRYGLVSRPSRFSLTTTSSGSERQRPDRGGDDPVADAYADDAAGLGVLTADHGQRDG